MKKFFLLIITTCIASLGAWGQTSSVSATITDSTSQAYANGTYDILFRPAPGVPGTPTRSGSAFTQHFSGVLDASGAFAVTLTRNDFVQPAGSQWTFTICPLAASACFTSNQTIAAASVNLTAPLHTVTPTVSVFSLGNIPAAYSSSEIVVTPNPGSFFWNLTTGTFNFWNGSSWVAMLLPSANNTFTGSNTFGVLNGQVIGGVCFANQYATGGSGTSGSPWTSADNTGGIQGAINACPDGGEVFLSTGFYSFTSATPITINKRLKVRGTGWNSAPGGTGSVIYVGASVGAGVDALLVQATPNLLEGIRLEDFQIQPVSGTPGRYGIHLDGGTANMGDIVIDHVRVDTMGNYAFVADNAGNLTAGGVFLLTVRDSIFRGGVLLSNIGDSIVFQHNNILGARDLTVSIIGSGVHSDGGAHGFNAYDNNITTCGGTVITNAWQGIFRDNDVEQTCTSTNAHNALVDIVGDVANPLADFVVQHNYLGCNLGFSCTNAVRIDRAKMTIIRDNYVARGSGAAVLITVNADRTQIYQHFDAPFGEAISTWLSDSGTNTTTDFSHQASGFRTFTPQIAVASNTGVTGVAITSANIEIGQSGCFGATSADPTTIGLDSCIWRSASGIFEVGNAFGNGTGQWIAAAFRSSTTGTAQSGFLRSANTDKNCTRNSAGAADDCFGEIQHSRGTTGCTTAAAIGGVCTTVVSWPSVFVDTNYTATCNATATTSGAPILQLVGTYATGSVTVTTMALTAVAAQFSGLNCTAIHD